MEDRYRSRNKMVIIATEGIEKGDGGAILRGDITQTSRKMAKGPQWSQSRLPGKS